jgi:2-oxoglutarate dehydrogenase E2 component (dihydrolipoamide succinyltransferase)
MSSRSICAPSSDDSIAIRPMSYFCMSWDHRAFDGVTAARFLAYIRDALQDRDWASLAQEKIPL